MRTIKTPHFSAILFSALLSSAFTARVESAPATIRIDGSSTVYPIIEAVAEEFTNAKIDSKVRVTAASSGTGGGFKKFAAHEIDICNASRPIKAEEKALLAKNKVGYKEIKVGYDGLSVVVNIANKFVDYLSPAELKKLWDKDSKVKTWDQVRAGWPKKPVKLYGPGTDSGTFDFFTEVINGTSKQSRADFTRSEDDNVLVQGIAGDQFALGYFGHAYVEQNKETLRAVPIGDSKEKAIAPTAATIKSGTYAPLTRPLFIYVTDEALKKSEVKKFIGFLLDNSARLVTEVGYVALDAKDYTVQAKTLVR